MFIYKVKCVGVDHTMNSGQQVIYRVYRDLMAQGNWWAGHKGMHSHWLTLTGGTVCCSIALLFCPLHAYTYRASLLPTSLPPSLPPFLPPSLSLHPLLHPPSLASSFPPIPPLSLYLPPYSSRLPFLPPYLPPYLSPSLPLSSLPPLSLTPLLPP